MFLGNKKKLFLIIIISLLLAIILCGCSERLFGYYHTVTYESFGGTIYAQYYGSEVITMPYPRKEGYTFEGWYEDKEYAGERVSFPYTVKENITLYAKYIDNKIGNMELVYNLIDGAYEVTAYNGTSFVIYIPEMHNGLPVTRLCENFIKNSYYTTTLYISKSVNEIKERLYLSRRLGAIDVNGNNETYSSLDGVLYNKDRTILVCYPSGRLGNEYTLPEETVTIAQNGIRNNIYLQNIILNKVVNSLDKGICDLISLRKVAVPVENTSFCVENAVLYNKDKTNLIIFPARHEERYFTVPNSVVEISDKAFMNAVLETITIGSKVTKIGEIQNCKYLSRINVAEGNLYYTSVEGVLFDNAGETLLKFPSRKEASGESYDYIFPSSVKKIASFAFENVKNIKKLFVNARLSTIESFAFNGECNLEEIYFQQESNLKTIEGGAFSGCKSLTKVNINSRIPPSITDEEWESLANLKIYVPENMRGLYEEFWTSYMDKLYNGATLNNYTITFDSQGGSFVGNVTAGFIITEPIPSKPNYSFLGWFGNREGIGERYIFPIAIGANTTLYACWG